MKIAVCIKQVPDTETKIKLLADKSGIDPAGIKWVINPYDEYAIEEALKIKGAAVEHQVVVFTLGPKPRAHEALRTALAMGADEAVAIEASENLDPAQTAKALAKAIQSEGEFGLVLTGKVAIDDNAASVSQMLAAELNIPHITVVSKLTFTPTLITVEREVEGGTKEVFDLTLPALVGANKGLNTPRYASLPGIMRAKKKVIKELALSSLGLSADGPKVRHINYALPPEKPPVKILGGSSAEKCKELARLLREESKVI